MPKADWMAIKTEYVTTRTSMRALAEKFGVSVDAIKRKAAAEKWTEERTKLTPKIHQKTVQAVVRKTVTQEANRIVSLLAIGEKLAHRVDQAAEKDIDSRDLQRLTVALRNLYAVMQPPKDGTEAVSGGLSVNFEGAMKEAAE